MSQADKDWEGRLQLLLARAEEAAERGDAFAAVEAIFSSGTVDKVVRILQSKFDSLAFEHVSDAVSEAVSAFIFTVREGKTIHDPKAYLYNAARFICCDTVKSRRNAVELNEEISLTESQVTGNREAARSVAIKMAKDIIAQLGPSRIQDVMNYIIDAVSLGLHEVTNSQIAEALGIDESIVKTNKSKGFKRLAERARQEGLPLDLSAFFETSGDEDETSKD